MSVSTACREVWAGIPTAASGFSLRASRWSGREPRGGPEPAVGRRDSRGSGVSAGTPSGFVGWLTPIARRIGAGKLGQRGFAVDLGLGGQLGGDGAHDPCGVGVDIVVAEGDVRS